MTHRLLTAAAAVSLSMLVGCGAPIGPTGPAGAGGKGDDTTTTRGTATTASAPSLDERFSIANDGYCHEIALHADDISIGKWEATSSFVMTLQEKQNGRIENVGWGDGYVNLTLAGADQVGLISSPNDPYRVGGFKYYWVDMATFAETALGRFLYVQGPDQLYIDPVWGNGKKKLLAAVMFNVDAGYVPPVEVRCHKVLSLESTRMIPNQCYWIDARSTQYYQYCF